MVDNVPITAGSGTNVASDDIAGVHYQRVKTTWGPDGTANDADVATGKPLPTQIRSATGLIPIGEPTDAKNTATDTTSVSGISIWKQISASVQALVTAFGAALTRGSGAVDSNTQRMVLATDVALPAGTNAIGKLAANTGVDIGDVDVTSVLPGTGATNLGKAEDAAHTSGDVGVAAMTVRQNTAAALSGTDADYQPLITDANGRLHSVALLSDGTNAVAVKAASTAAGASDPALVVAISPNGQNANGQATSANSAPVVIASDQSAVSVSPVPATTGGLSIFRSLDLDETEEEVKATAGQVYGMWVSNLATSTRFLKFYNATAANVTVGTTTPVLTLALPGNSSDDISGVFASAHGIAFGTAITVAATTGAADNDTGAPGANEVIVNIFYK